MSGMRPGDPSDDFANCAITRKEDFRDLFLKPFFFGCEADDPITASAFDAPRNPMSASIANNRVALSLQSPYLYLYTSGAA